MNKPLAPMPGTTSGETKRPRPHWLWRVLTPHFAPHFDLARHVFAAMLLLGIFYRLRLISALLYDPAGAALLRRGAYSWPYLLRYTFGELLLALILTGVVVAFQGVWWGSVRLLFSEASRGASPPTRMARALGITLKLAGMSVLLFSLWLIAAGMQGNLGVLLAMNTPLTYDLVLEALASGVAQSTQEFSSTMSWLSLFFIFFPLLALLLFTQLPPRLLRWRDGIVVALAVAVLALNLAYAGARRPAPMDGIRLTPTWITVVDAIRTWRRKALPPAPPPPSAKRLAAVKSIRWDPQLPFEAQYTSVALLHPLLVGKEGKELPLPALAKSGIRWNVLVVLMESTGLQYAFRPYGGKYAMPYLMKLAKEGWNLRDHYSPSNSSPRSIFSLFTGLYPMPEVRIHAVRPGLHYPTVFSFLDPSYHSFLVTPASLHWYFPRDFFDRYGPKELLDFSAIPVKRNAPPPAKARHEEAVVDFFLRKLRRHKDRPFFATYYSFVAHWPYPDFGPRYQRFPPTRKIFKYLNNLYLLDRQIERMHRTLQQEGIAERTILVLLGDHGEAFGQHPRNWTHSRHSYNENYQTPMVIHQPRLFAPREITFPTQHADILPTLLDAMGRRYNPRLFQGESLFTDRLRRRYIFLYGNEDTLSSISREGIKLQLAFKKRACWVYDLRRDPKERKRLRCKAYAKQREATRRYHGYQRSVLRAYNKTAKAKKPFFHQRHPAAAGPTRTPDLPKIRRRRRKKKSEAPFSARPAGSKPRAKKHEAGSAGARPASAPRGATPTPKDRRP